MATRFKPSRVTPFGNLWINACLAATQSLSQPTTSFIGLLRQGIHRTPLICFIEIAILFSFKCATPSTVEIVIKTIGPTLITIYEPYFVFSRIKALPSFLVIYMDLRRIELLTSSLQMRRSSHLNYRPEFRLVGVPRLELGTSVLSGLRSSQLSYTPISNTKILLRANP